MTKILRILHEPRCGGGDPSTAQRLSIVKENRLYTSGASMPIKPSIK